MGAIAGYDQVCAEIAAALGIKHARKLVLTIQSNSIVTVETEFYPEKDGVKQLIPILKKYELHEIAGEEA
jgi:hypothetical protein